MVALIGDSDTVELAVSLIKIEGAQIDPCTTAHLLVDMENGALALVPYGIFGIVDAAVHGLVTHIDGITSLGWEIGLIAGERIATGAGGGLHHTGGT